MLLAYSTLWRDKLRPEVRVRAALFSDNSALCAPRSALSALVSALIGKRIDRISAAQQLIIDDVLHNMSFFLLTEIQSGIAKPDINAVVFVRVRKILLSFDIVSLRFGKQERFGQMLDILSDGVG